MLEDNNPLYPRKRRPAWEAGQRVRREHRREVLITDARTPIQGSFTARFGKKVSRDAEALRSGARTASLSTVC